MAGPWLKLRVRPSPSCKVVVVSEEGGLAVVVVGRKGLARSGFLKTNKFD